MPSTTSPIVPYAVPSRLARAAVVALKVGAHAVLDPFARALQKVDDVLPKLTRAIAHDIESPVQLVL